MVSNFGFLLAVCMGQLADPCGYSAIVGPTTYVDYLYGTTRVDSKFEVEIKYSDGRFWKVPVVNGYMPTITVNRLSTGGWHYVLDYRCHIPYKKPSAKPEPKTAPELPSVLRSKSVDLPQPQPILVPKLAPKPRPMLRLEPKADVPEPQLSMPSQPMSTLPSDMVRPSDIADPDRVILPQYEKSTEK